MWTPGPHSFLLMLFKRSDKNEWYVKIPTPGGGWKPRSTLTTRRSVAERIEEALKELHPKQANGLDELLKAINDGRVALSDLARDPRLKALKELQKQLKAGDFADHIEPWHAQVSRNTSSDTADHYLAAVRSLFPEGSKITADDLARAKIQQWLNGLDGSQNTRRKKAFGMSSFCKYLLSLDLLDTNPVRDIQLPSVGAAREKWLETHEAEQLAEKLEGDHRALSALMAGSGIELSVALALQVRNVYPTMKEVFAPGTKTYARERIVRVADWAWPIFRPQLDGKAPTDLVFPDLDRWVARKEHTKAIASLLAEGHERFEGYTMRDQRHTYAVRAVRAGTPIQLVARQLGHADGTLVLKVYGKFAPASDERAKWEAVASAIDAEKKAESGVQSGVQKKARKKTKKPASS